MSDYSAVAPPPQQNFNQSSAFAAALQRAKQVRPGAATRRHRVGFAKNLASKQNHSD